MGSSEHPVPPTQQPRVRTGVWGLAVLAVWFVVTREGVRRAWFLERWEPIDASLVWLAFAISCGATAATLFWLSQRDKKRPPLLTAVLIVCLGTGQCGWHLSEDREWMPVVVADHIRWVPEAGEVEVDILATPVIARMHGRGGAAIRVGIQARMEGIAGPVRIGDRGVFEARWPDDFEHLDHAGSSRHLPVSMDGSLLRRIGAVRVPLPPVPDSARPILRIDFVYVSAVNRDGRFICPVYEIPFRGSPGFKREGAPRGK